MKETLIRIIPGLLSWIGGDSARFTAGELARILDVYEGEISQVLDILCKKRVLDKSRGEFTVTKPGSYVIDYSLLDIISEWCLESSIYSEYPHHTLQWLYVSHVPLPHSRLAYGIRNSYVLDFCQAFMQELTTFISDYDMKYYPALRNFVIKLSLHPTYGFVMTGDPTAKELAKRLLEQEIIGLAVSETSDSFVVLNSQRLRGFLDRHRKAEKAGFGNTRSAFG